MRAFALAVLAVALAACAGKPTPAAPAPAKPASAEPKPKFDFHALVKREAGLTKPFRVDAPDGSWSATISAVAPPKVRETAADSVSLDVDIGSERPLDCVVWKQRLDAATTLAKLTFEPVAKLPLKEIARIEVGVEEGSPNVTFDMFGVNERKEANHVKTTLVMRPHWTLGCRHDELGYAETVRSTALQLGRTFSPTTSPDTSRYHDVSIVRIGEMSLGYVERFFYDAAAGGGVEIEFGALVGPRKDAAPVFQDSALVSETDAAGLLRTSLEIVATADGVERSHKLERKSAQEYAVSGTDKGKEVRGVLKAKRPLRGERLLAGDIAAHAAAGGRSAFVRERWAPTDATIAPHYDSYTPVAGFDAAHPSYVLDDGKSKATVTFDRRGILMKQSIAIGEQLLVFAKVFSHGTL